MKKAFLRYALEFLIIVFGVSFSFYLEKQNAKNYKEELKNESLKKLKENISDEIDGFLFDVRVHSMASKYGNIIYYRGRELFENDKDSLGFYLSYVASAATIFVDNDEEYSALTNSGLIELIENRALVKTLQKKYSDHTWYKENGDIFIKMFLMQGPLSKYLSSKNRKRHRGVVGYATAYKEDVPFLNDEDINYISQKSLAHRFYSNILSNAIQVDSLILKEIDKEITKP